ncbi:triacylglycerol lipase [Hydrogenophaga sp.]|uniref:esterase/lipase family protein n=1 Tax=Hydrogenophaga sp. TaxID=1904254 RepID=UPI0027313B55|nr:alpha/beta hydrolase [Hydrogenophaga sp.]MDP2074327.1 alpha/beta hydrolase [Hydrogenophaga sp.]MDP3109909.1 alpha/beta hydrolase [Hydrogenophaga sp.]MDP3349539.1 alpha/beta hydrolase [Hydrogenophaga sp.]
MTRAKPSATRQALLRHLRPSDLQAAVRLATQATTGVIGIAEGVHQSVRRKMGMSAGTEPDRTGGLTGQIYRGIRGVTAMVGHGLDGALSTLLPLLDDPATHPEPSPGREAVLAALNGVMGDRLLAQNNPLAQRMELRLAGLALPMERPSPLRERLAGASPHLLLMLHGLCMNDTQWLRNGHDHGAFLAQALGCTPVYVRYNSGLHTSINGRELAGQLERLVAQWPTLESITVLGHSMGGLLARAAVFYGRQMGHRWPAQLKHLVFLGTPHHGAPLERAGHGVDVLLSASPFTLPFTQLGMLRSAGITDLRHGHVLDDDWQGRGRFDSPHDHRVPLPLPEGVACFTVAATLAPQRGLMADRLTGDGLVPLRSALGQHDEAARRLVFAKDSQRTVYRTGHLELLSSPVVAQQLVQWLAPEVVEAD